MSFECAVQGGKEGIFSVNPDAAADRNADQYDTRLAAVPKTWARREVESRAKTWKVKE